MLETYLHNRHIIHIIVSKGFWNFPLWLCPAHRSLAPLLRNFLAKRTPLTPASKCLLVAAADNIVEGKTICRCWDFQTKCDKTTKRTAITTVSKPFNGFDYGIFCIHVYHVLFVVVVMYQYTINTCLSHFVECVLPCCN